MSDVATSVAATEPDAIHPGGRLASRIGRHALIYVASSGVALLLGLALTTVQSHMLSRANFGSLGLLLIFSGLLTIAYNSGSLQGTLGMAFAGGGDDDVDDEGPDERRSGEEKARIVGTGLVLTTLVGLVGLAVCFALADVIAPALAVPTDDSDLVVYAAASALFNAQSRLLNNLFRYAQHPIQFGFLHNVRPLAAIATVTTLLALGEGVRGVVIGFTCAGAVAAAASIAAARKQYRLGFSLRGAATIYSRGAAMVPVSLGNAAMQQGAIYTLFAFGERADLADYRLAAAFATVAGYGVGSFNSAWGPLRRSPLHRASEGPQANAWLFFYFIVFAIWLLVALSAASTWLVKVAPGSYGGAAGLVPVIGASYCAWGLYQVSYRTSLFPSRRRVFSALAVVNVAIFVGISALAVPALGPYGSAIGAIGGFLAGALVMIVISQIGTTALPLRYGRIATVAAVGTVCALVPRAVADLPLPAELAIDLAVLFTYPALLLLLRAIPAPEARALRAAARGIFPGRHSELTARAATLAPSDLALVSQFVRRRRPLEDRASIARTKTAAELGRLTAFLAGVRTTPRETAPLDEMIGRYLYGEMSFTSRESLGTELLDRGVPPLELDLLSSTAAAIRRIPGRRWPEPGAAARKRAPSRTGVVGRA